MRFREIAEKCMHRLRETLSAVLGLTCICTAAAEGKVRGGILDDSEYSIHVKEAEAALLWKNPF